MVRIIALNKIISTFCMMIPLKRIVSF